MAPNPEKNWFKEFEALIWAASLAVATLAFIYTSFATKEYVDSKHANVLAIMETKHQSEINLLQDMKSSIDKIDQRTYDLAREHRK